MNIIELLKDGVRSCPDQVALIYEQQSITYRELDQRSQAVAAFFQARDVAPGQRALLLAPLNIEFYALFLGLTRIGVAVMLIDPTVGQAHIAQCCQVAPPDLLVGSPKAHLLRLINPAIRQIPRKFSLGCWLPGSQWVRYHRHQPTCIDAVTHPDDPALITFTSGSTGLPKGICRTHGFLFNQHQAICNSVPGNAGDVELNTLPVFILSSLARGITTVIPSGFGQNPATLNADRIIRQISKHRVNRLLAAPAFCQRLANHLQVQQQTLPGIERVFTGGGPVFPGLLAALARVMPNAEISAVYGSTEAEPIAHIVSAAGINPAPDSAKRAQGAPEALRNKIYLDNDINRTTLTPGDIAAMQAGQGLLAGAPIPEIRLAILPDRDGQPIGPFTQSEFAAYQLATQCIGEIVVTGEHVQKRYLGDKAQTQEGLTKFRVDDVVWHRTGDAGYLDGAGRLWLLGRCAARVESHGKMLYPFGIEAAAMTHPDVARAAFVQVDGENVLAIQPRQQANATLCQELQRALPEVDRVQVVKEIPMDKRHHSKVLYGELQRLVRKEGRAV